MVSHGIEWYWMVFDGIEWYQTVSNGFPMHNLANRLHFRLVICIFGELRDDIYDE